MSLETVQKFKKVFIFIILGVLAVSVLLAFVIAFFSFRASNTSQNGSSGAISMFGRMESGSGFSGYINEKVMMAPSIAPVSLSSDGSNTTAGTVDDTDSSVIVERKLMQDGNISLIVNKAEDSVVSLSAIATKLGGRIDSVSYQNTEGNDKKTAMVVLRVPAVNFESAMKEIKATARKVTSENISTRDVTEQFVDMQARLKTLKATEEQYLEILKKAVKIDDILNVSQYLSNVRMQIEQLQGEMNYLSRQVDMSIITVYLTSEPDVNPAGVIWNPKTTALDAMRDFMQTVFTSGNIIIRLVLFYLPIFILLGGIAYLIFLFYMKILRPWYEASKDVLHF
jgi:hypothetical protein